MKTLITIGVLTFSFPCVAEKKIVVDLKNFNFKAYEDGKVVKEGLTTGGKRYCPDIKRSCKSPVGEFRVLTKRGRYYRSPLYPLNCGDPKEGKEICASMAWSVKIKHSGESFHASNKDDWNNPKHISHGCFHLQMENAFWLNKWVNIGDTVIVLPY